MPLILTTRWQRPLMRGGYGVRDIAGALRTSFDARHEELLFEFGATSTVREKRLTEITGAGAALNLGAALRNHLMLGTLALRAARSA